MGLEDFEPFEAQIRIKKPLRIRKRRKTEKNRVCRKYSKKAILFPANPQENIYDPRWDKVGNITAHIDHLERTGGVFWRLCQHSKKEEFLHKINTGYIYDTSQKGVTSKIKIEKIVKAKAISEDEERFIPKFRRYHYDVDLGWEGFWWLLIRDIKRLSKKREWQEFILTSKNRPVKGRVRILAIVKDPEYV